MASKVECPRCRKRVPVEASDAGQSVLCLACGRPFRAPHHLTDDDATPATDAAATALVPAGLPERDANAGEPSGPTTTPPVARRGLPWVGWAVTGCLAAAWVVTLVYRSIDRPADVAVQTEPRVAPPAPVIPPTQVPPATAPVTVADAPAHVADAPPGPANMSPPATLPHESAPADPAPAAAATPDTEEPGDVDANSPAAEGQVENAPTPTTDSSDNDEPQNAAAAPAAAAPATTTAPYRSVRRHRGPLRPVALADEEVTDEEIEQSIRRGVDWLAAQYNPKTLQVSHRPGYTILATYALIQCSLSVHDPRLDPDGEMIDKLIERIKAFPIGNSGLGTYERGTRATALALLNRPKDRVKLEEDVACLMMGHDNGAYSYPTAVPQGSSIITFPAGDQAEQHWDNSNCQFGVLGVWAGAEAGVEVPKSYWEAVGGHWSRTQLGNAGWAYIKGGSRTTSMTAAGAASLLVVYDYLHNRSAACGRDAYPGSLGRALAYFDKDDSWLGLPARREGDLGTPAYTLYSLERVGLATGWKYFGGHDWYRELARRTIDEQEPDGSWSDGGNARLSETCFRLLFLARGRPPIVMNKLRFDGYWQNRPRDAANLARFASRAMERPLNFQVADLRREWHDWMDAPILYLASHQPPKFTDADYDKLRSYAMAGGMIFTHADCDSERFNRFAEDLVKKLFPQYELVDLPEDHPVYNIVLPVKSRPRLRAVSNGSRILLVHSPTDLGRHWHTRSEKGHASVFNLGVNLYVYATGKRDLRNRIDSPYVPPVEGDAPSQVSVARVSYAGQWDPEPSAWPRFANLFERRTGSALDVTTVKWKELAGSAVPLAHLSGTARYDPTADEVAALRAYVEAGGTLLIDTCGGTGAFAAEMKQVLAEAFPGAVLDPIPPAHPMLNEGEPGMADVRKPKYRPFTVPKQGNRPGLFGFAAGEGQVILTTLDVTSGLLHTGTWGISGFDPTYCESMMQNVVLWASDTAPDAFAAR